MTFARIAGHPVERVSMGLIKLKPGADPESVRAKLEFVWAEKIEDVLARALGEPPAQRAAA